ncbi:MAG: hypothetical protein RLZZ153_2520 [Pseudomonadota bacterium]
MPGVCFISPVQICGATSLHEWLYPLLVILAGYLVLGITGFGSALVVVPLLAGHWPLAEVVTLTILLDIAASVVHGGLNLKQIRWNELARLLPGMTLGSLVGLWLLGTLDKRWPLFVLGLYVAYVGLRSLTAQARQTPTVSPHWAHLAGLLIGLVEVMFATAGPVVVAWLHKRMSDIASVRATVPVVMCLAGSLAVTVLGATQHIEFETLWPRWLVSIPVAVAGVVAGNRLASHIPVDLIKKIFSILLIMSGISLTRYLWL